MEARGAMSNADSFHAVVVGGGIAGLEATLALREHAGDRVSITLVADREECLYRAPSVYEPFGGGGATRVPVAPIAAEAGAELVTGRVSAVLAAENALLVGEDRRIEYDAAILAPGATLRPAFPQVTSFDPARADEQLHGLIQDLEQGYVSTVVFLSPDPPPWPLPLYELTLMTAERCSDMSVDPRIILITSERAPLEAFGRAAGDAVRQRLEAHGVEMYLDASPHVADGRTLSMWPHADITADRIVALPRLSGPAIAGLSLDRHGFIRIDRKCQVAGHPNLFAAGDATTVPVKHGSVAAGQADTAAQGVAALAGADIEPEPLVAIAYGVLAAGRSPLYLKASIVGGVGAHGEVSDERPWEGSAKAVVGRLTRYIEAQQPS